VTQIGYLKLSSHDASNPSDRTDHIVIALVPTFEGHSLK